MRFTEVLLEAYNRRATTKAYGQKILAIALKDGSIPWNDIIGGNEELRGRALGEFVKTPEGQATVLDYIMGIIEAADPTRNKTYSQAIARLYGMGGTMLEDITATLAPYLVKFEKLKAKKKIQPPHTDLMNYKSINDFLTFVEKLPDPDSDIERQNVSNIQLPPDSDWRLFHGNLDAGGRITSDCVVILPLTQYGGYWWAKEYPKKGVTNRWCTAWEGNNSRFDYYNRQGPLYIIIPAQRTDDNEKYQFQFETNQFKDFQDHEIGHDGIAKLIDRCPSLDRVFLPQAIKYNVLGLMPKEFRDAIKGHSRTASEELSKLLTQYQDRIAMFGFSSLSDYGISIPEEVQQQLKPAIGAYLDAAIPALSSKGGFWSQVVDKLGSERSEDKLEVFLNMDPTLKNLLEQSEAGQAVAELARSPEIARKVDASHLQDLLLRDPLFRFIMRQVPKLYIGFLNDLSAKYGASKQGVAEGFNSKQEMIAHFVKQGKSAASGAAAWERTQGKTGAKKKSNPFDPNYKVKPVDNSRYGEKDLDEGIFGSKAQEENFEFYLDGCDAHAVKKYLLSKFGSTGWKVFAAGAGTGKTFVTMTPGLYPTDNEAKWDIEANCGQSVAEDDWHGAGDDWHGAGNDPVDAWHSPEGSTDAMPQELVGEDWQKVNKHDKTDGMSRKAVGAYRREHPGSKLKTAVTTKPSKLKPGSKAAKRRKSFCARMSGVDGPMKDNHGKPTAKAKALRRWNCESAEDVKDLLMIAESIRRGIK